ncbi:PhoU family transcriptional regulator [Thermoplasma sp. Kam2015]|uniref:phosphate signaling complex PhoU family protein n=1 Tax=Thermoplasma sp. Kam2015 TaxID=2094122 RepID=UPI000DA01F4A|nr:phosphate uptake regulator PhoU [Thermoplasma sp. Kam2015]PYB69089.1 PhoU family transcriptional regulator [Thermoplasma sp. Kam2015]
MEHVTRKVQVTGGSTFIISLPPEWVKRNNINKGSEVSIIDQGTELLVEPANNEKSEVTKKITLPTSYTGKPLQRLLTSMYISGFDTLLVVSKDKMTPEMRDDIKRFAKVVMGIEVIEETSKSIVLQNVLNANTFSLEKAIRRMSLNVSTMIEDTIKAIHDEDDDLIENIVLRDDEVDRYQWYIYREVKIRCRDERSNIYILVLSRILERIADHAVNICQAIKHKKGIKGRDKMIDNLTYSNDVYKKAMETFYSRNFNEIDGIINRKAEITQRKYELLSELSYDSVLSSIAEEISRIGLYGTDIAELAMDLILSDREEFSI